MNESKTLRTIEHLPNEILLEIFRYINARDLHRALSKLNKHFTAMLHTVSMHAHLTEKNDFKTYKSCFRYYPSNFIYIRIEQICDIPETFDVSGFTNIRSLHLGTATCHQYDQITSENMPYLIHLSIDELQAHRNPICLPCGTKQFVNLTTYKVPYFFSTNIPLQICLTLRSLHLKFASSEIFLQQIKPFLPNLVYFNGDFRADVTNIDSIRNIPSIMIPHNVLRYLKIQIGRHYSLHLFALLLTVMPELRVLEVYCQMTCDYEILADLLRTKVPKLKQFYLIINGIEHLHSLDIDIVKRMSPWFSQIKTEINDHLKRIIIHSKTN